MSDFTKTEGWLDFCGNPSKPDYILPAGAVDAHCHVFGPGSVFPYAPERKYTPCDAGKEQLYQLRDHLGFDKNVIVQATCHGADNSAMADAVRSANGKAKGIATVRADVTDYQLDELNDAGVRGVRFNFVKRLVDAAPKEELLYIANKITRLGWHIVVYFEAPDLDEMSSFISELPTIVVIDHMGRPDVTRHANGPEFAKFLKLMDENENVWVKTTGAERVSLTGPAAKDGERRPYRDVVPFAGLLIERFPDRVLWGTDWPHPNLTNHMPDDGLLVDIIPQIAATRGLQKKLLVDNPTRLYWG